MRKVASSFLWLFVFTIPLDRLNLDQLAGAGIAGTITRIVGGVAFIVGAILTLFEGRLQRLGSMHVLVYGFMIWAGISGLWSLYPDESIVRALTYGQLVLMVWLIAQFASDQEAQVHLLSAYVAGAMVVGGSLILGYVLGSNTAAFHGRYTSLGYNPNDLALTLALGVPFAWHMFVKRTGFWGWFGFFYGPVAILGVLLSASRGGAIATLVAMLIIPFTLLQLSRLKRMSVLILAGLAIVSAAYIVPETSWERVATLDDNAEATWSWENVKNLRSNNMRLAIWEAGMEVFSEHPVLGIGAGGFVNVVSPVGGERFVAHNVFVSILVELGVIGCVLFVVMLLGLGFSTRYMERSERVFWLMVLLTYTVGGLFLTWEHTKQTWLVMGLLAARMTVLRPAQIAQNRARPFNPMAMIMTTPQPIIPKPVPEDEDPKPEAEAAVKPDLKSGQKNGKHLKQRTATALLFEERQRIVVQALLTQEKFIEETDLSAFFHHLAKKDHRWKSARGAQAYFRRKLKEACPKTLAEWRTLAEVWAETLPAEQ